MSHHYMSIRMAKFQALKASNAGKDVELQELFLITYRKATKYSYLGRYYGNFLHN